MRRYFSVSTDRNSVKTNVQTFPLTKGEGFEAVRLSQLVKREHEGALETRAVFQALKSMRQEAGLSLIFEETEWDTANYVFAPAALYNGNRFCSLNQPYPPMASGAERELCGKEPVISDVPRLEKSGGSRVQLSIGDLSIPCIGFYSREQKRGWLLFWEQKNEHGDFGITVSENAAQKTVRFLLSSPCVREEKTYQMCTTNAPSSDRGVRLRKGDTISFAFREYVFDCGSVTAFLNRFFQLRAEQGLPRKHPHGVPWSHASALIEEKYNLRNWLEKPGFYRSSEAASGLYRQWQTGWVGGAMNTLPGLAAGNTLTRQRSRQTLEFMFRELQHPSGFLYGVFCDGKRYGDDFNNPEHAEIVMSRKNADALYFLAKQLLWLRKSGAQAPSHWENGLRRLADAFVAFYQKNGELGQFIDMEAQVPFIGGSASAGIAPAGLVLCGQYFNDAKYISTAEAIAERYYQDYVAKGFTNGGPGEILACPDSESAFGLLESFVALHAETKEEKWLQYAVNTASICASWCVAYDYAYSKNTQFYRHGVSTTGAVWASVQNKHAAPGICTLSGASLFRLYRATGDIRYLELCRDISHNITQFVSTPENPIYASYVWHNGRAGFEKWMRAKTAQCVRFLSKRPLTKRMAAGLYRTMFNPIGRMNERVNLSDWEGKNNVGEVPLGSCWPEVSVMLTYFELPAVYVRKDTGFCFALDHVDCGIAAAGAEWALTLTNPTDYDAQYRLLVEGSADCAAPLGDMALCTFQSISVGAHQKVTLQIGREC